MLQTFSKCCKLFQNVSNFLKKFQNFSKFFKLFQNCFQKIHNHNQSGVSDVEFDLVSFYSILKPGISEALSHPPPQAQWETTG